MRFLSDLCGLCVKKSGSNAKYAMPAKKRKNTNLYKCARAEVAGNGTSKINISLNKPSFDYVTDMSIHGVTNLFKHIAGFDGGFGFLQ